MRKSLITLISVLAALALVPAVASAASTKEIIRDCSDDGIISGTYSASDLAKALDALPSDAAQYTDCAAAISTAQGDTASRRRGGGSSGGTGGSSGSGGSGSSGTTFPSGTATTTPDLGGGGAAGFDGKGSTDPLSTASTEDRQAIDRAVDEDERTPKASDVKLPEADVSLNQARAESDMPTAVVVALVATAILAGVGGALALLAFLRRRREA